MKNHKFLYFIFGIVFETIVFVASLTVIFSSERENRQRIIERLGTENALLKQQIGDQTSDNKRGCGSDKSYSDLVGWAEDYCQVRISDIDGYSYVAQGIKYNAKPVAVCLDPSEVWATTQIFEPYDVLPYCPGKLTKSK